MLFVNRVSRGIAKLTSGVRELGPEYSQAYSASTGFPITVHEGVPSAADVPQRVGVLISRFDFMGREPTEGAHVPDANQRHRNEAVGVIKKAFRREKAMRVVGNTALGVTMAVTGPIVVWHQVQERLDGTPCVATDNHTVYDEPGKDAVKRALDAVQQRAGIDEVRVGDKFIRVRPPNITTQEWQAVTGLSRVADEAMYGLMRCEYSRADGGESDIRGYSVSNAAADNTAAMKQILDAVDLRMIQQPPSDGSR